jgi:hypothetical protein
MEKNCPNEKSRPGGQLLADPVEQGFEYGAQNNKQSNI